MPWAAGPEPRIAGVSSFGFSGTNAHVIVADPVREDRRPEPESRDRPERATQPIERPPHVLALSAQSDEAAEATGGLVSRPLDAQSGAEPGRRCHTANAGRAHFPHRLAVVADRPRTCGTSSRHSPRAERPPGVHQGRAPHRRPAPDRLPVHRPGSQYPGMARDSTRPSRCSAATYRSATACCGLIGNTRCSTSCTHRPLASRPFLARPCLPSPWTRRRSRSPPCSPWSIALGRLWRSWGVVPAAVMGHSVGEYVAACLAGVFDLEDGLRLIAARGAPDAGAAARRRHGRRVRREPDVRSALAAASAEVSIAAVNGPRNVVVSGDRDGRSRVLAALETQGVEAQRLNVSHAFHSPLMEPMLTEFEREAAGDALVGRRGWTSCRTSPAPGGRRRWPGRSIGAGTRAGPCGSPTASGRSTSKVAGSSSRSDRSRSSWAWAADASLRGRVIGCPACDPGGATGTSSLRAWQRSTCWARRWTGGASTRAIRADASACRRTPFNAGATGSSPTPPGRRRSRTIAAAIPSWESASICPATGTRSSSRAGSRSTPDSWAITRSSAGRSCRPRASWRWRWPRAPRPWDPSGWAWRTWSSTRP